MIGIISLGDVSVKSGEDEAGEALEEISSGVRQQQSGSRNRLEQSGQGRPNIVDDLVNTKGEKEPEFQNAGGGKSRQRVNKQNATTRVRQESSTRGRDSGPVRGESAARSTRGNAQGISNRSSRQENQRQQKVAPMRAEGKNPRGQNKRKAG